MPGLLSRSTRTPVRAAVTRARHAAIAATLLSAFSLVSLSPARARAGDRDGDEAIPTQPSQNRPPEWADEGGEERQVRVDDTLEFRIVVSDPDHDTLRVEAVGMPHEMRLVAPHTPGATAIELHWRPRPSDVGRHEITLSVSDGRSTITKTVTVFVTEEWQSYLLPGAAYSVYAPSARSTYGTFQGVSGEILIGSWIHRNENRGPSHGRVYVDMDVLKSSDSTLGAAFDLSLGFDLAIERDPSRRFLLPYFGLKVGRFMQAQLPSNGFAHVTPVLGLYVYADRNLFVHGSVGYVLPISAANFDPLRGVRGLVGVDFSLW